MASAKPQPEIVRQNSYTRKWNILFDKVPTQWISFKPQAGLNVYPCYACRDMFGSKNSFLDHVNRRGILLTYKCYVCSEGTSLLFYNPCSFLLHARHHYSCTGGQIDLNNLTISTLPLGLAGFLPHPDVPMIYDEEDDGKEESNLYARFYSPERQDMGKQIINLTPTVLLFCHTPTATTPAVTLVLKQISSNIPRCMFVLLESHALSIINNINKQEIESDNNCTSHRIHINEEPPDANHYAPPTLVTMPQPKQKINTAKDRTTDLLLSDTKEFPSNFNRCPECKKVQATSMSVHFTNNSNKPLNDSLKCVVCKYVAPSECSLQAHQRIHEGVSPFVCPECGKDFGDCETLLDHLDDVCFHLAKQVRFRCPKKNCCKVFAQIVTFIAHIKIHIQALTRCCICSMYFCTLNDYTEHTKLLHGNVVATELIHRCTVCKNGGPPFNDDMLESHTKWHCSDRSQRVYVYVCKYCRNFFRSTLTYATHLLRCAKKATLGDESYKVKKSNSATICNNCNYIIRMIMTISHCPKCGEPFNTPYTIKQNTGNKNSPNSEDIDRIPQKNNSCLLCNEHLPLQEHLNHIHKNRCKYYNPVVLLNRITIDGTSNSTENGINSPKFEESFKKKRKKPLTPTSLKSKKLHVSPSEPKLLKLEEPMPFSGTYHCRLCPYMNENRADFHNHVVTHRDVSTVYQCMECGECFVVKPSLEKHLLYYHQVFDFHGYMEENNCFDKNAVGDLKETVKLVPSETKQAVAENQCQVCMQQFRDPLELNKHFRIHGMAFLLKNIK